MLYGVLHFNENQTKFKIPKFDKIKDAINSFNIKKVGIRKLFLENVS